MPMYCSVYGCSCSSEKNPELSFFQYPKDSKLLRAWTVRVRRENFTPTISSYVCSNHFEQSDIYIPQTDTPSAFRKQRLRTGALPSVNLRRIEGDERKSKRSSSYLARANSVGHVEPSTISSAGVNEAFVATPCSSAVDTTPSNPIIIAELTKQIATLETMSFRFKNMNDADIKAYTGIEKSIFNVMVETVDQFSPLNYWSGKPVKSITPEDQLLIFLIRLRLDLPYFDIAKRYSVSQTTIQNIVMTYLHTIHEIFFIGAMKELPSQEKNKCAMPIAFESITNCRIIIDCTEFRIASPRSDLSAASSTFSNYKHFLSAKYLLGVAPNGAITFVSNGFPGSTSDKSVTNESGIISHIKVI